MDDKKLWRVFSIYIRLKYSDANGFVKCFTCGRINNYKKMDCGHGFGRQHRSIKFDEKNNHPQCGPCNLDGGRQDIYKEEVNKKYGPQTWDLLELKSRSEFRWTQFEIDALTEHYKKEVRKLAKDKMFVVKI